MTAMLVLLLCEMSAQDDRTVVSSPNAWPDNDRYLALEMRTSGGIPPETRLRSGKAMVVGHTNPFAVHAGLEALKHGGNAADAVLATALAQIALNAGAAGELCRNSDGRVLRREFRQGVLSQCSVEHAAE